MVGQTCQSSAEHHCSWMLLLRALSQKIVVVLELPLLPAIWSGTMFELGFLSMLNLRNYRNCQKYHRNRLSHPKKKQTPWSLTFHSLVLAK